MIYDTNLLKCDTYEEYVDSYITRKDIRYLRNVGLCRKLVLLGYRSPTDIHSEEQFYLRQKAAFDHIFPSKQLEVSYSENLQIHDPILRELARREKLNQEKKISTIIFIKAYTKSGFEISSYIDYEESLRHAHQKQTGATDWAGIFKGKVHLRSKSTDLSFFDWHKGVVNYNNSDNYIVIHDIVYGLTFMYLGDRKKIRVETTDPKNRENFQRFLFFSPVYGYVVLYDHNVRKKI